MALITSRILCEKTARRREALDLRRQGLSITAIAERLGRARSTVFRDIRDELQEASTENALAAGALRELETQRLDDLLRKEAAKDTTASSLACLAISARRSKMLGIDLAVQPSAVIAQAVAPWLACVHRVMVAELLPDHVELYERMRARLLSEVSGLDPAGEVQAACDDIAATNDQPEGEDEPAGDTGDDPGVWPEA